MYVIRLHTPETIVGDYVGIASDGNGYRVVETLDDAIQFPTALTAARQCRDWEKLVPEHSCLCPAPLGVASEQRRREKQRLDLAKDVRHWAMLAREQREVLPLNSATCPTQSGIDYSVKLSGMGPLPERVIPS